MKEPLGRGYERGYEWPSEIAEKNKENHKFGQPILPSENVKHILYPVNTEVWHT